MNPAFPPEASEFGAAVRHAIESRGAFELVRAAALDPGVRDAQLRPLLEQLDVFGLDPRAGGEELAACAAACRAVGVPESRSAPAATSARTTESSPLKMAPATGDWSLVLRRLTSAPRPIMARTVSSCPW